MTLFDDQPMVPTKDVLQEFWEEHDKPLTPHRYHASSVLQCPAKHWFQRTGVIGRPFPQGIGERGRRAEDYVLDAFKKKYGEDKILTQVPTQKEIAPGITVSGKVDVMVIGYNLKVRKIVEVKSMEGSPFDLKRHYEFQALFYDWVYEPQEGTEVLVINTGDYEDRMIFPVEWTGDKMIDFIDYWSTVDGQFQEGGEPVRSPSGGWECWFPKKNKRGKMEKVVTCPFYEACKGIGGPVSPVPENLTHMIEKPVVTEDAGQKA